MAFERQADYVATMFRTVSVSIVILVSLLPIVTSAAPAKRHAARWHGYGFLPGYRQPVNETVPVFGARGAARGGPDYTPSYWYNGDRYYFGRPGFFRGRYNGGSIGPCWTQTPIGPIWNCG
jgi:hypothetical protein